MKVTQGNLIAKGKKFGVICSRFNDFISSRLLDGCVDTLKRHGAKDSEISLVWVPGSFELPYAAQKLAKSKKYDALIALGAVIRGSTPHFEYVASETAKSIANISLATGVPVIFGVITADNLEQAIERAGTKQGNKGRDAAISAIEMANVLGEI